MPRVAGRFRDQVSKLQLFLFAAAAASYAVGYPLGLASHLAVGWVLVTLGGVFLVALGTVTVRRMNTDAKSSASETRSWQHRAEEERPVE